MIFIETENIFIIVCIIGFILLLFKSGLHENISDFFNKIITKGEVLSGKFKFEKDVDKLKGYYRNRYAKLNKKKGDEI